MKTPEWVKDAVFYQIFPDRFAKSNAVPKPPNLEPWDAPPTRHGFKGGDLMGVVERLDYLRDLGITAIYLNPVFQSAANHRYHTYDYYHVDPLLGGNGALRTLLDEAHRRGMHVVLDGVFNHASRGFYQFHHILENGADSPYLDWFIVKGFPLYAYDERRAPNYEAWWNLRALPKFNTDTPAVREFLWGVACHWVEFGIDGWRLDVPEEIDDPTFWQEFRRRVKDANPEAYLVGEIWHEAPQWLRGDRFDAVMNYLFTKACLGFFIQEPVEDELVRGTGYAPVPSLGVTEFAATIDPILGLYDPEVTYVQLNLLDSHDTARFLTLARGDESAFRLATLFQMTYPGAPCVYYGNEIGLEGRQDPDCRRAFPWDERHWNTALYEFVKRCIALRHAHPALRRGDYTRLHAQDDVYAFGRRTSANPRPELPPSPDFGELSRAIESLRPRPGAQPEGPRDSIELVEHETLIVTVNVSRSTRTPEIRVAGYLPDGAILRAVWSDATVKVAGGVIRDMKLAPRSGIVWVGEELDLRR